MTINRKVKKNVINNRKKNYQYKNTQANSKYIKRYRRFIEPSYFSIHHYSMVTILSFLSKNKCFWIGTLQYFHIIYKLLLICLRYFCSFNVFINNKIIKIPPEVKTIKLLSKVFKYFFLYTNKITHIFLDARNLIHCCQMYFGLLTSFFINCKFG